MKKLIELLRNPLVPWIICVVCVAIAAFAADKALDASDKVAKQADVNSALIARFEAESRERRDQACRGAENLHKQEIEDLKDLYAILKDPPPVYSELLQNPVILADLKETIGAAEDDQDDEGVFVAPFCDEPGLGLPEPDPEVPERPDVVNRLLAATE